MDCPACHAENGPETVTCAACGRSLRAESNGGNGERRRPRSGSRRRGHDNTSMAALDSDNPKAHRAYRVSIWSVVPGFGLLLGPLAMFLGFRAVRGAGDDLSASNRAKAAILFGAGSALTQWLGVALLYYGWGA